jgi:glyoxylase-like metal-dependent hydrolase (beta-lactamase superfamily II)
MLRWSAQQAEADALGAETIARFAGFSPVVAELLDGARFRPADIVFADGITLDLGGVHVQVSGVGPNHTLGDTVFFVAEDRVLFTGDVVMPVFPAVSAQSASIAKWLENMDAFEVLEPETVVPAHGRMGDAGFIRRYREYLTAVQQGAAAGLCSGATADETVGSLAEQLARAFPDLQPGNGPAAGRINSAIQAAYRESP